MIIEPHKAELRASGLSDETIAAAGLYSITDPAEAARTINWKGGTENFGPWLAFPFFDAGGQPMTWLPSDAEEGEAPRPFVRLKPATPHKRKSGSTPKYETPLGSANRVYIPPGCTRAALADPEADLIVTEGEKKCLCADQHGFACLGLSGVEGWSQRREKGGRRELLPDLAATDWSRRRVFIAYDSDARRNPNVRRAERALRDALAARGAAVYVVRLPDKPDGTTNKLDDHLRDHGAGDLRRLLDEAAAPRPKAERDFGEAIFNNPDELDRLAALKVEDPAGFAAECAALKKRGRASAT